MPKLPPELLSLLEVPLSLMSLLQSVPTSQDAQYVYGLVEHRKGVFEELDGIFILRLVVSFAKGERFYEFVLVGEVLGVDREALDLYTNGLPGGGACV